MTIRSLNPLGPQLDQDATLDYVANKNLLGGFWGPGLTIPATISIGQAMVASPNLVRAMQFSLRKRWEIGHVTAVLNTGVNGSFVGLGLYDEDANLLLDSGPIVSDVGITLLSAAPTRRILPPGTYYYAWTATSASVLSNAATAWSSANMNTLINRLANRLGACANASVAGQLPASLGAITPAAISVPMCFWEF
jgi:hypothetical protein